MVTDCNKSSVYNAIHRFYLVTPSKYIQQNAQMHKHHLSNLLKEFDQSNESPNHYIFIFYASSESSSCPQSKSMSLSEKLCNDSDSHK